MVWGVVLCGWVGHLFLGFVTWQCVKLEILPSSPNGLVFQFFFFTLGAGLLTICLNFLWFFQKKKKQCVSVWHPSTKTCNYFHHNGWKLCEGFESSRVFDFYLNLLFLLWGLNQMLLLFSSLSVGGEQAIGEGSLFQKLKKINLIMSCVIPL